MTNIPTELLRTLLTVVDLRSFTKAAHRLGVTQPAVSAQIKRLQFLLGFDVLDKSAPGVSLTERGSYVVNQARRLLAINDQIVAMSQGGRAARVLRFGLPGDFVDLPFWRSLADFRARRPDVRLHMKTGFSSELLHGLEQGDLDVVVAMTSPRPHEMARHRWREEMVWVRGAAPPIDPSRPLPIVSRGEACLFHRHMVAALDRAGRAYECVLTASHIEELVKAVAAGLGLTALTRPFAQASLLCDDVTLPKLADVACNICVGAEGDPDTRDELAATLAETLMPQGRTPAADRPAVDNRAERDTIQSVA